VLLNDFDTTLSTVHNFTSNASVMVACATVLSHFMEANFTIYTLNERVPHATLHTPGLCIGVPCVLYVLAFYCFTLTRAALQLLCKNIHAT